MKLLLLLVCEHLMFAFYYFLVCLSRPGCDKAGQLNVCSQWQLNKKLTLPYVEQGNFPLVQESNVRDKEGLIARVHSDTARIF